MSLLTLSTHIALAPTALAAFVFTTGILLATASSLLQTGVFALASLFGSAAVQAVISGQAAVGVAVSIAQFASVSASVRDRRRMVPSQANDFLAAVAPASEDRGAIAFFGIATLFTVVSLVAHVAVIRTKQYKAIVARRRRDLVRARSISAIDETSPLIGDHAQEVDLSASRISRVSRISRLSRISQRSFWLPEPDGGRSVSQMLLANKVYNFNVAFVFIVTLAVFPPITTIITSVSRDPHSILAQPLFFSSVHFLLFNVGDLLGRFVPSYPRLFITSPRNLLTFSIARVLFIPLFLLCHITPGVTPLFNSDIAFFLLVLLLGLSNGYGGCATMVCASSLELNPKLEGKRVDVDTAATVASFSLVLGLVIGSVASFGVRAATCGGCNPFVG